MVQRGDGVRFALKAFGEMFGGSFDRNVAAQARVVRLPNLTHATLAEWREDFVGADFIAGF